MLNTLKEILASYEEAREAGALPLDIFDRF